MMKNPTRRGPGRPARNPAKRDADEIADLASGIIAILGLVALALLAL